MIGLGNRLRSGRLTLGLRLGLPSVPSATINNTLASSTLVAETVIGLPALFIALYARHAAIVARSSTLNARRLALATRIASLES